MKMSKMFLAAATFVLLSGPLGAHANIIYDWTGTCVTGCAGQATMHLVLSDDYVPGSLLSGTQGVGSGHPTVVLQALYTDSVVQADVAQPGLTYALNLPATMGAGVLFLDDIATLNSNVQGIWKFEGDIRTSTNPKCHPDINPLCPYFTEGVNGVWTRVPAPSTFVLLGVGFAGLVFYRRREVG